MNAKGNQDKTEKPDKEHLYRVTISAADGKILLSIMKDCEILSPRRLSPAITKRLEMAGCIYGKEITRFLEKGCEVDVLEDLTKTHSERVKSMSQSEGPSGVPSGYGVKE